jgi:hypothetical protein
MKNRSFAGVEDKRNAEALLLIEEEDNYDSR